MRTVIFCGLLIALALSPNLHAAALPAPHDPPAGQQDQGPPDATMPANRPATMPAAMPASMPASMPGMNMSNAPDWQPSLHNATGTGWQPAATPEEMWMKSIRSWDLMAHGVVFIDYNQPGGPRGAGKMESVNWLMLMQEHKIAQGSLLFREMFSAESLTAPHPGFPELFQTGETYHGQPLIDHQHPHNVFSELSVYYGRPISKHASWELYGAAAGEPALGPVAFMHRASALDLPMAPLSHHLQDSTHTSFGVITAGLQVSRVKFEASAFNGREPDEARYSIQFHSLDSWSGRVSVAPTRNWAAQYSYGRLERPEALEPGSQRRQTASVGYTRPFNNGWWATSIVWGRVQKVLENRNLNGYLLESTVNFKSRNYIFSRLELVDKDELFPLQLPSQTFRIGAWTAGASRDLLSRPQWKAAIGGDVTFYTKPPQLDPVYGNNPVSFQIFLRVRIAGAEMRGAATESHP